MEKNTDSQQAVLGALSDKQWDFRTIDGLAKSTKLPRDEVLSILEQLIEDGLARESLIKDEEGQRLFTIARKRRGIGEILNLIRSSVTKS